MNSNGGFPSWLRKLERKLPEPSAFTLDSAIELDSLQSKTQRPALTSIPTSTDIPADFALVERARRPRGVSPPPSLTRSEEASLDHEERVCLMMKKISWNHTTMHDGRYPCATCEWIAENAANDWQMKNKASPCEEVSGGLRQVGMEMAVGGSELADYDEDGYDAESVAVGVAEGNGQVQSRVSVRVSGIGRLIEMARAWINGLKEARTGGGEDIEMKLRQESV